MTRGPTPDRNVKVLELMRARPPDRAVRWVVETIADDGEVSDIAAMPGGSTAAMHRVTINRPNGTARTVVLRRYVLGHIVDKTPDIVTHEAHVLELVAPLTVPTPELLAHDPTGEYADAPALVMSMLEGRPAWETLGDRQLEAMAEALVELHAVPLEACAELRPIRRYDQVAYEPPRWTSTPALWERAFEIFQGPIPADDLVVVHRDFHPGNLLWRRGRLTGIVDWQAACVGPASIDVGHCCLNMTYYDARQADRLRAAWERASGRIYDPWADVMSIIGVLDSIRTQRSASAAVLELERSLGRAVAALGG